MFHVLFFGLFIFGQLCNYCYEITHRVLFGSPTEPRIASGVGVIIIFQFARILDVSRCVISGKGRRERDNPFLVNNYDSLDMNNLSVNDTIQPKGVDKTPLGLVGLINQLGMVLISILY